jgi:hypothetical protein
VFKVRTGFRSGTSSVAADTSGCASGTVGGLLFTALSWFTPVALVGAIALSLSVTAAAVESEGHYRCTHGASGFHCHRIPPPSGLFSTPLRLCQCTELGPRGGCVNGRWTCRNLRPHSS